MTFVHPKLRTCRPGTLAAGSRLTISSSTGIAKRTLGLKPELYSPDLSPFSSSATHGDPSPLRGQQDATRRQRVNFMKTRDGDQIYELLGFHDGSWIWYGSSDVTLPQEVYDRLAREITGMFAVGEQVYWIRPAPKEPESKWTPKNKKGPTSQPQADQAPQSKEPLRPTITRKRPPFNRKRTTEPV